SVRCQARGDAPARRAAAPRGPREAGAARDEPPDPDRRGRGGNRDRARRLRRPPGNRAGGGAPAVCHGRGNRRQGERALRAAVRRRSDLLVRVPMRGAIGSLNAAVAGSILLYEALSQRGASPGSSAASETRPKRRAKTATEPRKGPRVASEASAPETTPPTEADDLPPDGPSAGG